MRRLADAGWCHSQQRHPLTMAQRSRKRQACGQPTTVRKHCRLSATWRGRGDVVGVQARAAADPRANRKRLLACTCEALTKCGYAPHPPTARSCCPTAPSTRWPGPTPNSFVAWTSPCWLPVIEQLQETALAACSNPQQTDAVSSRCQLMPRTVGAALAYPRDQLSRVGEAW
jgi:hypothetical protein